MMNRIVAYKYTQYTTPRFGGHVRVFLGRPWGLSRYSLHTSSLFRL
jgi:hypothetical protein